MSSKIKVDTIENVAGSGNVSLGSGHNLVVPGNITGQGTAAITSNATVGGTLGVTGDFTVDTSTLKVDSSNNRVGIGLTAPQELLHLKDGDIAVGNGTASNNAVVGRIGFSTDSSNSRFTGIESFRGSDAANTDLRFHTFGGDGDAGERMRIHNNGYVTRTKTAGFFIGGTSAVSVPNSGGTGAVTYTSGNILTSSTEIDPDGVFNHSNGRFTAPVAGDYYFCFSIAVSYSSNYHYSYIRKNNSDVSGFSRNSAQNSDYIVNTIQGVMTLAANDYVTCARNTNYNAGAVMAPMFSGFLLG